MKIGIGWVALGLVTLTCSCEAIDDVRDALDEPIVQQALGLTLAGVTPAPDFASTGNIRFDVLTRDQSSGLAQFANLQQQGMKVEVENDDGTYSDCEHVDDETVEPSPHHTLTLLLDGSGSMELAYPPSIYGDTCVTCPHDPTRERIVAARELILTVHDAAADSTMAVAEFGPDPTEGFAVTRLHSDFVTDADELIASLDDVQGYEPVGTPLYDSLAEMIEETRLAARDFETTIRQRRGEDTPWEELPGEDVPEADREVARHIVILSDGEDNESVSYDAEAVAALALDAGVQIYAVGLGPASATHADPDTVDPAQTRAVRNLQQLAVDTGGFYAAADNPSQLAALYETLGHALTEGYQVETYSCVPRPTHDTPHEECDVPSVGSRIDGRVSLSDVTAPWVTVAN